MKGTLVAIVGILWLMVVDTLRGGATYPLPQVLPFCSGSPVGAYDFAGCVVLLAFFLLLWRSCRGPSGAGGAGTQTERRAATGASDGQRRFRHSLWLIPLTLVSANYIRKNVSPSIHWHALLVQSHIPDPERLSQLVILIATCVAVLVSKYIWQRW